MLNSKNLVLLVFPLLVFFAAAAPQFVGAQYSNLPYLAQSVTNCNTNVAISGAQVSIAGQTALTDSNGNAFIYGLQPLASYNAVISANGFQPINEEVNIHNSNSRNNYFACLLPNTSGGPAPVVTPSRNPSGTVTSADQITLTAKSYSNNPISYTAVSYTLGQGQQQTSVCSNSNSCSVVVGPLQPGVTVTYFGTAVDKYGNQGTSTSDTFTVVSTNGNSGNSTNSTNFPPSLDVSRNPSGIVPAGTPVTITASSYSAQGIQETAIAYQVGSNSPVEVYCQSDLCQAVVPGQPTGTTVIYQALAEDSSPQHQVTYSSEFSYTTVAVQPQTGSLTVHAYDCNTGASLPSAQVSIQSLSESQTTDSSGNTFFSSVNQGNYLVDLNAEGYSQATSEVSIYPNFNTLLNVCANSQTAGSTPTVSISRAPAGQVLYTQQVTFTASSSDPVNGILWTAVVYTVDGGTQIELPCSSNMCTATTGPFAPGTTITYWGQAKNGIGVEAQTTHYTFTVGPVVQTTTTTSTTTTTTSTTTTTTSSQTNGGSNMSCAVSVPSGLCTPLANSSSSFVCAIPSNNAPINVPISVSYFNADSASAPFSAVSCGNGVVTNAFCINQTQTSGQCTGSCQYPSQGTFNVSAAIGAIGCSPATVIVNSQNSTPSNGAILVKVIDSTTFAPITNAEIAVAGQFVFTDSFGEATFTLPAATYVVNASATGHNPASITTTVIANQTDSVQIPLSVTTAQAGCFVSAFLTSSTCNSGAQHFTMQVQSNSTAAVYSTISFNSPFLVSGPTTIYLPSNQPTLLNYTLNVPQGYSGTGMFNAVVSSNSSACAGSSIQVPLCSPSGITLQLLQDSLNAEPGTQVCTQATVTNSGTTPQQVQLVASGNYPSSFSPQQITLGGQASATSQFCISVPDGADGSNPYTITANTATGLSASAPLQLNVFGQSAFTLNYSNCNTTNSTGPSGLYTIEASAPGFTSESQNNYVQQDFPNVGAICLPESNASITTPPQVDVYRSPFSNVVSGESVNLIADAYSPAGIRVLRIFYAINNNQYQQVSCNSNTCSADIGPFNQGDTVTYYAQAVDASVNANSQSSNSQTFSVFSSTFDTENAVPQISLSITPTGTVHPSDAILLSATATSSTQIQDVTIFYKINGNSWQSSECNANSCSFYLGPQPAGTQILYYATALDTAAPANGAQTDVSTLVVSPVSPTATIGNLLEYVYDCNTLAPISGATVGVSGASATYVTDVNGYANIASGAFASASPLAFSNNPSCSCITLPSSAKSVVPVSVYNNGPAGDFSVNVQSSYPDLYTATTEPALDGLGNGQWRTTYLDIDTNSLTAGNYSFGFNINSQQSGTQVYSTSICVYIPSTNAASVQFVPDLVSLAAGQNSQVQVQVQNTGNAQQTFTLTPVNNGYYTLTLSNTQIQLNAGQEQTVNGVLTVSSAAPVGNYQIPLQVYANGGVVQYGELSLNVVPYSQVSSTPLSGLSITANLQTPLPTSGTALVPITITNNNLYPISGATVFFSTLPVGAISKVAGPFSIPAFGSSLQLVEVDTNGIAPSFYPATIEVQSPTDSAQINVELPIGISAAPLLVSISAPQVSYSFASGTDATIQYNVTNNELGALNLTSFIDQMPSDWVQTTQPTYALVAPHATVPFTVYLHSDNSPTQDYNASIVVLSSTGRLARAPVQISALTASGATGFFVFSTSGGWVFAVVLGLLIVAGALFYMSRNRLEDATEYHKGRKQQ